MRNWRWAFLQFMVRWLAQSQGFLDPVPVLARLRQFSQPSEVAVPTEVLRVSSILHARGLINSQAIQHNLDWVWPYWVVKQFDPRDPSFVPRAFSLTHINLTHRNWTAVGLPDVDELPLVDPRGLVTPWLDGWSLDGWIISQDHQAFLPSNAPQARQQLAWEHGLRALTDLRWDAARLQTAVEVVRTPEAPACRLRLSASCNSPAWLVLALRPYNPEGISFIHEVTATPDRMGWHINRKQAVRWSEEPDRLAFSEYRLGDVSHRLFSDDEAGQASCPVGMATAAAMFEMPAETERHLEVTVPLAPSRASRHAPQSWEEALQGRCEAQLPDARWQMLFETALRALVLHAGQDVYPGPYTYKRFWFRDAAFILHALACMGLVARAERALERFPLRQTRSGYFQSQDGEWDSNGQALWIFEQFCLLTGMAPKPHWRAPLARGAQWLRRKRLPPDAAPPHAGLMPPGFSAEHLGPNDYYYWDNFWAVAGLESAARLFDAYGDARSAGELRREAQDWRACIDRSLEHAASSLGRSAVPASPTRRMDAGAIGSLAASYPLQLWAPDDPRLMATVEYLLAECCLEGGFFQNITHSGINPYLTLHLAQALLRADDPRAFGLQQAVADLASPTGQWPEAIHPATRGGCMGDGQHVWASAEWLLMLRNGFVREERGEGLVLGAGIPRAWLEQAAPIRFGPTLTPYGPMTITIRPDPLHPAVSWEAAWRRGAPKITVRLPGCEPLLADNNPVIASSSVSYSPHA